MNKNKLIETIVETTKNNKKQVEEVFDCLINTIVTCLKNDEEVSLVGFGSFSVKKRHSRNGVNPQNPKEKITVPEVRVAKFKTGKMLKDVLKNKR